MRLVRLLAATAILMALAVPAFAVDCTQTDGQPGVYINGTGSPDDQCLTADEYSAMVSAEALLNAGLIEGATDNGDGTVTLDFGGGAVNTIPSDPLDQKVSSNPEWEPDAPTVREVLFSRTAYAI